jgi:transcriptional regulator with XRE-family HTH domain
MPRKSAKKPPILQNYRVDPAHIGQVIAARRQAKGLSMLELSDLAGVSPSTILKLEKGEITIQLDKFLQIVDQLSIPLSEIVGFETDESDQVPDPFMQRVIEKVAGRQLEDALLLIAEELKRLKNR